MMLAFNKYVVPFQLESHVLSFNMAGLDTIKYRKENFSALADAQIKRAIEHTTPGSLEATSKNLDNSILQEFLLGRSLSLDPGGTHDDVIVGKLARPFGFFYFGHFSGLQAAFVADFQALRVEQIVTKWKQFNSFWTERTTSMPERVKLGFTTQQQAKLFQDVMQRFRFLVFVGSDEIKKQVLEAIRTSPGFDRTEIVSPNDVKNELSIT